MTKTFNILNNILRFMTDKLIIEKNGNKKREYKPYWGAFISLNSSPFCAKTRLSTTKAKWNLSGLSYSVTRNIKKIIGYVKYSNIINIIFLSLCFIDPYDSAMNGIKRKLKKDNLSNEGVSVSSV